MRDCTDTPTAGSAMRSLSLKSAMVLTRVVADQVVEVAQRGHALDVLLALGAVPQREQRAHAGAGDIDIAGQQGIVDGRAAGSCKSRP
jgi:hypothetical protein